MMQEFGSIGLYRNEAEECCNSEHKKFIDNHSPKGGFGRAMTFDCMLYALRKLYKDYRHCDPVVACEGAVEWPYVTWDEYREMWRNE